jgi:hypothetical protein
MDTGARGDRSIVTVPAIAAVATCHANNFSHWKSQTLTLSIDANRICHKFNLLRNRVASPVLG